MQEIENLLHFNVSTIFHEPTFNKIIEEVFHTKCFYLLVYKQHRLVALCPLHAIKKGIFTVLYSNPAVLEAPYGGWVYRKEEVTINDLISLIKLNFNEALIYWSLPQVEQEDYRKVLNKIEFKTSMIDLNKSLEEIFNHVFSGNKRSKIRRAIRKGVIVEKGGIEYLDTFYDILHITKRKRGINEHPKEYYKRIIKYYEPLNKCKIFLSKINNRYLSGIIVLRNEFFAHYWVGGMYEINANLYQNDYIHWEAIKWAKQCGSKYYDLCVVEQERLPTIAQFKLGFSKNVVPFYYIGRKSAGYKIGTHILKIIKKGGF